MSVTKNLKGLGVFGLTKIVPVWQWLEPLEIFMATKSVSALTPKLKFGMSMLMMFS